MVNTLNPNKVIDEFIARVREAELRHKNVQSALAATGSLRKDQKGATVDFIFRVGGEFELFQHNWMIATISKKPSQFVSRLNKELADEAKKLPGHGYVTALGSLSLTYPRRPTADQIESLLDKSGQNVTFRDVSSWRSSAVKDLAPPYIGKLSRIERTPEDVWPLDLLKSVRNAIAHGSARSKRDLNRRLAPYSATNKTGCIGALNAPLRRTGTTQVRDVSTYLYAAVPGGRRVDVLVDRVVDVVDKLRTP